VHIVKDSNPDTTAPQEQPQRQLIGPWAAIVVPPYRAYRCYRAQALEYLRSPDVTGGRSSPCASQIKPIFICSPAMRTSVPARGVP